MTSSLLFDQFFSNIQEIIDIANLFASFFFAFYHHYKLSGNEEITVKQEKVLLYYCAIVKYMCLFFYQLTSYLPNQVSR